MKGSTSESSSYLCPWKLDVKTEEESKLTFAEASARLKSRKRLHWSLGPSANEYLKQIRGTEALMEKRIKQKLLEVYHRDDLYFRLAPAAAPNHSAVIDMAIPDIVTQETAMALHHYVLSSRLSSVASSIRRQMNPGVMVLDMRA